MTTGRGIAIGNGNWRNFFQLNDSSYQYTETDGDFTQHGQGNLELISGVYSASLLQDPQGYKADDPTATSSSGSSPYAYFIKRYNITTTDNTTGGNGYIQIVVKTSGYTGDTIIFDNVQ